jgi:hypothetical protein
MDHLKTDEDILDLDFLHDCASPPSELDADFHTKSNLTF